MWEVSEDEVDGLVTVRVDDEMSDLELTRTKVALKYRMGVLRILRGKAHVLFDLTGFPGDTTEVIRHFQHVDGEFIQDKADRVALVLRASIDKSLARPLLKWPEQSSLFLSSNAARVWLASQ